MNIIGLKTSLADFIMNAVLPQMGGLAQWGGLLLARPLVNAKVDMAAPLLRDAGLMDEAGKIDSAKLKKSLEDDVFSKVPQVTEDFMGRKLVFTKEHVMQILERAEQYSAQQNQ